MVPFQIASRRRGDEAPHYRGTTEGLAGGVPTSLSERLAQVASRRERRISTRYAKAARVIWMTARGIGIFLAGVGAGTLIRDVVDRFL